MAYITEAYLELHIERSKLDVLLESPSVIAAAIASAESMVEAALQRGGYTQCVPASVYAADASDCPELIRVVTRAAVIRAAYSRHDLGDVPADVWAAWSSIDDIGEGRVEIPGVSRSVSRSVGGIHATAAAPPQPVFRRMGIR